VPLPLVDCKCRFSESETVQL